jgi:signal transduction histidine kinase
MRRPVTEPDQLANDRNLAHLQRMAALGELASGITHDFRNVLQTVISTLELIESQANAGPAEVRRLVSSALQASERGIGLTKRLLTFSRIEAAAVQPASLLPSLEGVTETLGSVENQGIPMTTAAVIQTPRRSLPWIAFV